MKQFNILFILLVLSSISAQAQSSIRLSNFWVDPYTINPAAVDKYFPTWKVSAGLKKQWVNYPGSPSTGIFTGAYYNEQARSQIGVRAIYDKIGYTTTTDIGLTYAYTLNLAEHKTYYCVLNMGLGARYQNLQYDASQAIFETPVDDPRFYGLEDSNEKFNADVGLELNFGRESMDGMTVGLSMQNIASLISTTSTKDVTPFANTDFLYLQYYTNSHRPLGSMRYDFSLGAAAMTSKNIYAVDEYTSSVIQWEGYGKFHVYYTNKNMFTLGALFRTKEEFRTVNEWGIIVEHEWRRNLTASFVYENNFSSAVRTANSAGTFELALIYRFGANYDPYDMSGKQSGRYCHGRDGFRYY
jgi:type IX secretion system PorP/SprF family membrane protein